MHLDEQGDRIPDFHISNLVDGVVVNLYEYSPLTDDSELHSNITFVFPGNTTKIPLDVPICGFHNEFCIVGRCEEVREIFTDISKNQ